MMWGRTRRSVSSSSSNAGDRSTGGSQLRRRTCRSWFGSADSVRRAAQRVEYDGIDLFLSVDALLEVRCAGPVLESFVAENCEAIGHLPTKPGVERDPAGARRLSEELLVEAEQATELLERPLVIVDAEIDDNVREPRVSLLRPDDEERCGLLPPTVAACGLRGVEAFEE